MHKHEFKYDTDGLVSRSQRPVTDYETATNRRQRNKSVCTCAQGIRPATKKARVQPATKGHGRGPETSY